MVGDRILANANHPVAADGRPVSFPPLHNHHVHLRKGDLLRQQERYVNSHWFESHGDYVDGPDFGVGARSAAGYITRLPHGSTKYGNHY